MNKVIKSLAVSLLVMAMSISSISADDLGFLEIKNDVQLSVVKSILDHAYTKVENKFLVSYSPEQKRQLVHSGINLETVVEDADVDAYYLSYPDRKLDPSVVISKFDDVMEIGADLRLSKISNLSAVDSGLEGFKSIPLTENEIFFHLSSYGIASMLGDKANYPTDSLADYINLDTLVDNLTHLRNFYTRYIWTDSIDIARDWIEAKYQSWGYSTGIETFYWNGGYHDNVYAIKQGYAEPDKVIVIGGHFDSITYNQPTSASQFAPGTDDNATGTVLAMEMARVLANIPTRKTIIFYAFTAEEVGLVGSRYAASQFAAAGTDIEVMFNYDMVAHNPDATWMLDIHNDPVNSAYTAMTGACAERLTSIIPLYGPMGGSSDHYGFFEQGFTVVNNIEADFNYTGWHTDLDEINILNMPYYHDVNKMAIAALAIVANSTSAPENTDVFDVGDGQALEISWSVCNPAYTYTIQYRDITQMLPVEEVAVPDGLCSYTLTGLNTNSNYSVSVYGLVDDAYPPVSIEPIIMAPMVEPRTPASFVADPDLNSCLLSWAPNTELDFSHYRVYRDEGSGFELIADNVLTDGYTDNDVIGQTMYTYKVSAVDNDSYESVLSAVATSMAATFDAGILIVDENNNLPPMPIQAEQDAFFDMIMGATTYDQTTIESAEAVLDRLTAGQYSSIFWIDDDLNPKLIENSEDSLAWYLNYTNNMMITGMRTLGNWTTSTIPPGHILYDEFGLSSFLEISSFDFLGANGANGWPDVNVRANSPLGAILPYVPVLTTLPGTEVIYTYRSNSGNPTQADQPCGIMFDSPSGGKRILLGFPLYYLNEADAKRLITHAKILLGEYVYDYIFGDVTLDGVVDVGDIVFMVDYMFRGGSAPLNNDACDVDGNCTLDIGDLVHMVDYQFRESGIPPGPGCVN